MQLAFSKEELALHFSEINTERINQVWTALRIINELNTDRWDKWAKHHLPAKQYNYTTRRLEPVMEYCDRLLGTYGIEPIRIEGLYVSKYWQNRAALYLNTGETYQFTLIADIEEHQFILSSVGNFVEELELQQ